MDQDLAPPRQRRLRGHGMHLRRRRIFARLREGLGYDEIAADHRLVAEARKRARAVARN